MRLIKLMRLANYWVFWMNLVEANFIINMLGFHNAFALSFWLEATLAMCIAGNRDTTKLKVMFWWISKSDVWNKNHQTIESMLGMKRAGWPRPAHPINDEIHPTKLKGARLIKRKIKHCLYELRTIKVSKYNLWILHRLVCMSVYVWFNFSANGEQNNKKRKKNWHPKETNFTKKDAQTNSQQSNLYTSGWSWVIWLLIPSMFV